MIIISIVTGTFNRLKQLQLMIKSARISIGTGIPYEIIAVDGGSTDGTQDWCKSQADVVLIEQGKLLGAINAFNAGAYAASGKYVVLANDDITFINESIMRAVAFMEDNMNVGIGCFYQDRYGKPMHVEFMGAVKDGKQTSVPYGQVCIVRKWLGDEVGWWGNLCHTYAGDNELSCNVLEAGYDVRPVEYAQIHDNLAMDELRAINNPDTNLPHPDSVKWVKKWTRNGKLGPIIQYVPTISNPDVRQRRILYAPIYEPGHVIQHGSKRGLRDALIEDGNLVVEVDYLANPMYLFDVAGMFDPDIILTQLHGHHTYSSGLFKELRDEHPNSLFINWNGDCFKENLLHPEYIRLMKLFDLVTVVTTVVDDVYNRAGINWRYWQIGFEESDAKPAKDTPRHDVVFLGNGHYDYRMYLGKVLRSISGVNVGIYGSGWAKGVNPNGYNLYDYNAGARLYKASKIAISDTRPGFPGFVSNRIFQAMVVGVFLMQQRFDRMEELLGFEDGKHLIVYDKHDDLPELIRHWLSPEMDAERKKIAKAGQEFVIECHSFKARVVELNKHINGLTKKAGYAAK